MIFTPVPIGMTSIPKDKLNEDIKAIKAIGPCGIGEKAVYLNSFFLDRRFYAAYQDIDRVFKRLAMSKGGFTGKGMFGSMPYLVVQLKDGREKQCNFKYEDEVDQFLTLIERSHPEIPVHSKEAERRLQEELAKEEARYVKELSPEASCTVESLRKAKAYLEEKPEVSDELSLAAKQKRIVDRLNPGYKYVALLILFGAIAACLFGVKLFLTGKGTQAVYFLLFGVAFILYVMSANVLPTGRNNKRAVQLRWEQAVEAAQQQTAGYEDFPVPAKYAHPASLSRMIRVIREGRAQTTEEAYQLMKSDLKAINADVTVTQKEYDEIIRIKPMFLICNYMD